MAPLHAIYWGRQKIGPIVLLVAMLCCQRAAFASYAIYVGKNLTADGSVLTGGSGDEVSSHWLEVVPAKGHPKGTGITVGVTTEAFMPGKFIEIPQVRHTFARSIDGSVQRDDGQWRGTEEGI